MKTINVYFGVFEGGACLFRVKSLRDYPDTPEAIDLLNDLVGIMTQAVQTELKDGHYLAWDYDN